MNWLMRLLRSPGPFAEADRGRVRLASTLDEYEQAMLDAEDAEVERARRTDLPDLGRVADRIADLFR